MLTSYIAAAMEIARYEVLEDGTYYCEVEELPGVWSDGKSLEECRRTLHEVIEDWLLLMLKAGDEVPVLNGIDLNKVGESVG